MLRWRLGLPLLALPLTISLAVTAGGRHVGTHRDETNTCLAFVSTNLAKGNGNWFTYDRFSEQSVKIQAGDTFVYSILLDQKDPEAKGGIDIDFADAADSLRDLGLTDQNGLRAHGDGVITPAVGKWYERRISIDTCKGRIANSWNVLFEGDRDGRYAEFIDDVYVEHRDGSKTWIYQNGPPSTKLLMISSGYTEHPSLVQVNRDEVKENSDLTSLIMKVDASAERLRILDDAKKDIDLAKKFVARHPDPALEGHIKEAEAMIQQVESKDSTAEEMEAVLHAAQHALSHTHPAMEQYTGHLVGHAHIDLQWLWEWQEGIVFSHDTFAQAVKFMDEFPGFTFSQSSSALYQTTEEHYPDLFKKIQEKVKKGQWEIVGGRVCEGDTNMISPESQARHFLYGQRYFREKFGKTAIVGWEPDTFGHTIQMPQILKLGGCNYYYFCRGGKGKPLFWWQGLDGTKVLAFDEPASGSWYNSDLSYKQFQEMLDFEQNTGSKDMLWVYGVGNHGGGPTREYIETALGWMKDPTKPKVKFSTATQFFKKLETYDLKKIPVIDEELNPVFDGCYTTHSEIKQLNRQAEALTSSAEAVATVASLTGFAYPKDAFRKNWEDICFNHHHDTLPGSGIHAPYDRTKTVLGRVLADDKDIITRAMEMLAIRVTPQKGGVNMMVFNPTGWTRSGWVETYLVKSGWDQEHTLDPAHTVAQAPDGKNYPVVLLDGPSRRARFWAPDIPPFGYRVFHLTDGDWQKPPLKVTDRGQTVETGRWIVEFDQHDGCIGRLFDKETKKEFVARGGGLGRLEAHYENPAGMSAWVIGKIDRVDTITPSYSTFFEGPDNTRVVFGSKLANENNPGRDTTVTQSFTIWADGRITCDVDCDWQAIGTSRTKNPMLRVAFDTPFQSPTTTYEVPFGALVRPNDGREFPALKWADMGEGGYGLSVLNDSKHGYSASGNTMRLTLIRSSFEPDPVPNPGQHHWRYEIVPHAGTWKDARIVRQATELNQDLLSASVPFDARGTAPLEYSPLSISDPNVVATALKLGEDHGDLIIRGYESTGAPSQGSISLNVPGSSPRWVNFVEDDLGAATMSGNQIPLNLHGFEIRTVKIKLKK